MIISLIKTLSYFGIFLISLVSTSTLFLPFPLYSIIIISSSLGMNPFLVSLASGLGMAIGELTGYFIGRGGGELMSKSKKKIIKKLEKFFKKFGMITIMFAAFLPFPFDIVGILAGMGKIEVKKFFIATFIGKFLKALFLTYILGILVKEVILLYSI
ncbi:MAG: VTT domain-containing protein [Candidatus Aenigmatarchaeota archaeon]